ncbi:MAG: cation-transporting P-type ATPase, partial [Anaerolineales bacterium]|nr:cation-transporting P-type ATPase [Anaerolineales bacterium]
MAEKIIAHAWSIDQTAQELGTDLAKGLTSAEARARLEKYGPNELKEKPRPGFLSKLWDQINNFLIWILIAAMGVSLAIGIPEFLHT